MTTKTIDRLDIAATFILLVWAGMAFCVNVFVIPSIFKTFHNYELAELTVARIMTRLDIVAWIAFGTSLLLVKGTRFMMGISEYEILSQMRLWSAAALLALLVCFTSTFIVAPKLCAIRSHVGIAMEVDDVNHINASSPLHKKASSVSRQLTWLRLVLAFSMAIGINFLPRQTIK